MINFIRTDAFDKVFSEYNLETKQAVLNDDQRLNNNCVIFINDPDKGNWIFLNGTLYGEDTNSLKNIFALKTDVAHDLLKDFKIYDCDITSETYNEYPETIISDEISYKLDFTSDPIGLLENNVLLTTTEKQEILEFLELFINLQNENNEPTRNINIKSIESDPTFLLIQAIIKLASGETLSYKEINELTSDQHFEYANNACKKLAKMIFNKRVLLNIYGNLFIVFVIPNYRWWFVAQLDKDTLYPQTLLCANGKMEINDNSVLWNLPHEWHGFTQVDVSPLEVMFYDDFAYQRVNWIKQRQKEESPFTVYDDLEVFLLIEVFKVFYDKNGLSTWNEEEHRHIDIPLHSDIKSIDTNLRKIDAIEDSSIIAWENIEDFMIEAISSTPFELAYKVFNEGLSQQPFNLFKDMPFYYDKNNGGDVLANTDFQNVIENMSAVIYNAEDMTHLTNEDGNKNKLLHLGQYVFLRKAENEYWFIPLFTTYSVLGEDQSFETKLNVFAVNLEERVIASGYIAIDAIIDVDFENMSNSSLVIKNVNSLNPAEKLAEYVQAKENYDFDKETLPLCEGFGTIYDEGYQDEYNRYIITYEFLRAFIIPQKYDKHSNVIETPSFNEISEITKQNKNDIEDITNFIVNQHSEISKVNDKINAVQAQLNNIIYDTAIKFSNVENAILELNTLSLTKFNVRSERIWNPDTQQYDYNIYVVDDENLQNFNNYMYTILNNVLSYQNETLFKNKLTFVLPCRIQLDDDEHAGTSTRPGYVMSDAIIIMEDDTPIICIRQLLYINGHSDYCLWRKFDVNTYTFTAWQIIDAWTTNNAERWR